MSRWRGDGQSEGRWTNWSGLVECSPRSSEAPDSVEQLCEIVAGARVVRVAGSGHSFTELVPSSDVLLSLERLAGVSSIDPVKGRATISAGTPLHAIGPRLAAGGLSLRNQGDIDRQALAGALSTATHGTGLGLGCMASAVTGFSLVTASGDIVRASSEDGAAVFAAGRVGLGAFGVLLDVELDCEPRYGLREQTWTEPTASLVDRWEELAQTHRHFEFFAFPFTGLSSAKTLELVDHAEERGAARSEAPESEAGGSASGAFGALLDLNLQDPAAARSRLRRGLERAEPTERTDVAHRVFPSQRDNRFNEMEYAVPMDEGAACLREVLGAIERADLQVLFPIEFRTVARDDCWLSPFFGRDAITLSVHQDARQDHRAVFDLVEPILVRYGGRPHWGKLHSLRRERLAELYPKWQEFQEVRRELDPQGKFLSPYLRDLFGEEAS